MQAAAFVDEIASSDSALAAALYPVAVRIRDRAAEMHVEDVTIEAAERRMIEAHTRWRSLAGLAGLYSEPPLDPIEAALATAHQGMRAAYDAWLALVEARDAKGGGA